MALTLTINGVDGFLSNAWTFNGAVNVIDNESILFPGDVLYRESKILFSALPNTTYTLSASEVNGSGCYLGLRYKDSSYAVINSVNGANNALTQTFTTPSNCAFLEVFISNRIVSADVCSVKRIMLNMGAIPAPYTRKTGNKMVMPVPVKNLVSLDSSLWELGSGQLTSNGDSTRFRYKQLIPLENGLNSFTTNPNYDMYAFFFDKNGNFLSGTAKDWTTTTFVIDDTIGYCRPILRRKDISGMTYNDVIQAQPQVEKGTATAYQDYAVQTNKKARRQVQAQTGLKFDGVADYLQLPSMTMDSIELDCLIDSNCDNMAMIFDTRNGTVDGWIRVSGEKGITTTFKSYLNNSLITGAFPKSSRIKIKSVFDSIFTDDVRFFASNAGQYFFKGIIYKITCYLNGSIVAQYDFENPSIIQGTTVLQDVKNLIPSFEDPRWILHANTQILGKDVLRLNATGASQWSTFEFPVIQGEQYFLPPGATVAVYNIYYVNQNDSITLVGGFSAITSGVNTTIPAGVKSLRIYLYNPSGLSGTYDFAKVQMFRLTGNEGTISGNPDLIKKQSKRTLYAKR